MSEGHTDEIEELSVTTPPCTVTSNVTDSQKGADKPRKSHKRPRALPRDASGSLLATTIDPPDLRKACYAFCMDRSIQPPLEPPLFAALRGMIWNASIDFVGTLAQSSIPVQGNGQVPDTQDLIAEGARAILEGDCLAAAHVPLNSDTPSSFPVSSCTSGARRASAPVGRGKAAAKRGRARASLPTPRRAPGKTRSRSGSQVESESAPALSMLHFVNESVGEE